MVNLPLLLQEEDHVDVTDDYRPSDHYNLEPDLYHVED